MNIKIKVSKKIDFFIGDTTYGGSGANLEQQFFSGGSFMIHNFIN